jgi:TetR/AcrR family transcriptional regulator, tetracycline repressor protein
VSGSQFEIQGRRSDSARAKGRVTLTRADVIRAGAQLLDTHGVEQLSMRKLAKSLGTGPATLYWHVHDKDELLQLILDDTLRGVVIPEEGSWDERLVAAFVVCYEALRPRPALVDVLWGAAWELGPETLRIADGLIALVAESGLPAEEVSDAYFALITLLFGFVTGAGNSPGNPSYSEFRALAAHEPPGNSERFPNLARFGPDARLETMDRKLRYALDRFISGIKLRVAEVAENSARTRRQQADSRKRLR